MNLFYFSVNFPIKVQNGGLFLSRGIGVHPTRKLTSFELIYVQEGTLSLQEEKQVFHVNAGEVLLLWPDRTHAGINIFPADLKFYWLHFELSQPIDDMVTPTAMLALPQQIKIVNPDRFITLFRLFLSDQEEATNTQSCETILLLLLQDAAHSAAQPNEAISMNVTLAYKARKMIKTQYSQKLNTSLIAKQLHCNSDYLGRVYRNAFRLTLTEEIYQQRIKSAERLLLDNRLSINEIAVQSGFNDSGYFRRVFKKKKGISPLTYRKLYCKEHINSD